MAMNSKELTDYKREYNKETYKTVKVYIREEEYPAVIEHMKKQGYTKLSGYIKDLIQQDMEAGEKQGVHVHDNNGKVIVGDINGNVNM